MALIEFCFCASDRDLKVSRGILIPQIACKCRRPSCLQTRKIFPPALFFLPFRVQRRAGPSKRGRPRTRHFRVNWSETGEWYWLFRSPGRVELTKPTSSQKKSAKKRHWTL